LGAGIYDAGSGGSLTVTSTTLAGNTAVAKPGDIASGDGGNACGGGIYTAGPITLDADTISGDATAGASEEAGSPYISGNGAGGGLCLALTSPRTEDVLNSTITGNTATGAAGPEGGTAREGLGGGIFNDVSGPLVLASDTIAANSAITGGGAGSSGGNLYMDTGTGLDATETIIANGSAATATTSNCFATSTTSGHDLESVSPSQCGFSTANGDLIGADPLLEPLAANGGATQTLALNAASPALGAGGQCIDPTQSGNPPLTVDQRGLPRSAPCDIGAFQHQPPANTTAPTASGSPAVGQTLTCTQGAWSGDQPLTFAYQWLRDGTAIASATATTYPVASSDAGHQLSCQVTAHNVYATATATSAALTVPVAHNSAPKPTITALRESHKTWREGSKLAAISLAKRNKPPPVATTFSFTLNTRASVTLTFTRTRAGRETKIKHKTECVAKTKHNTHKPTCTRTNHAGSITLTAQHGANSIIFEGRLSPIKRLEPGSYSVTAVAVNATGSGRSNAITFTIATS